MAIKKSQLYATLWKSCDELRGSMDASQYKDYILVLLFVKYISDRYGADEDSVIQVPKGEELGKGGGFADLVFWKNKDNIGDEMNIVIGRLADANGLRGIITVANFNDPGKLQHSLTSLLSSKIPHSTLVKTALTATTSSAMPMNT
jgi:type I restriction enzyme M protein